MKSRLEKVYNKLPNQKLDLKTQKINLSLIQNLENEIINVYKMTDMAEDTIKDAKEIIEKAKNDAFDFVNSDLQTAFVDLENSLRNTYQKLEEVGLDKSVLNSYSDDKDDISRILEDLLLEIQNL